MQTAKTIKLVVYSTIALLAVGCASTQRTPADAGISAQGETIALRYQWPDGLKAKVETISVKSQSFGQQSRTQDMSATYTMQATRDERGTAVNFADFDVTRPGISAAERDVEKILAFRPGFLLDPDGKLIEVLGLDQLKLLLAPLQQRLSSAQEAERQGLQALARSVTSEQFIKTRAGTEWGNIIGLWLGKSLQVGSPEKQITDSSAGGADDAPIATETKISIARIETCPRAGANGCVRLRLTQEPNSDALREVMKPKLNQLLGVDDWGPAGPPDLQSIQTTSQLIVDTEPDTLVPHRIESIRVMSLDLTRPDDGSLQVRDSTRSTSTYTYDQ